MLGRPGERTRRAFDAVPDLPGLGAYAGFYRRLLSFVIDWTLCLFLPSILSSFFLVATGLTGNIAVVNILWVIFLGACVLGYFTYFSLQGQTPGMKVAGIHVVTIESGESPPFPRALIRGVYAVLFAGSLFILVNGGVGDLVPEEISSITRTILFTATTLYAVIVFGHVWMIWDARRQTLHDKLSGTIVVTKQETSNVPG